MPICHIFEDMNEEIEILRHTISDHSHLDKYIPMHFDFKEKEIKKGLFERCYIKNYEFHTVEYVKKEKGS